MPIEYSERLAGFSLDLENQCLWRGNQEIPLTPKIFAMLRCLVEYRGRLVTKETLLEAVWPKVYVVESDVKHYVGEVRKLLHDDPTAPRFIETIRGRGYRFIGEITVVKTRARSGSETRSTSGGRKGAPVGLPGSVEPIGREAELAQLQAWLEPALAGKRQLGFISGEPGAGKTTLVTAFLRRVVQQESIWIAGGRCLEAYGAAEPYRPLLEALEQLCHEPGSEYVVECLSRYAPSWLLQIPGLLASVNLADLERRTQGAIQGRMQRELAQFFDVLSAQRGLVLWFEDLHWADDSTLGFIASLAQRSQSARLLVLGTYRAAEVQRNEQQPLRRIHADLQIHKCCDQLPLQLLSEAAVAEYLKTRFPGLPAALARVIHRRSGGNPLFMVNLVDHLRAHTWIAKMQHHWMLQGDLNRIEFVIPDSVRRLIEHQLEQLTPGEQELVEVASVIGPVFSAAAAAAGLAREIEATEEDCGALVRREQFLRRTGIEEWPDGTVAAQYEFLHTLYHQALYERITPSRRMRLHRLIGERIERGYGEKTAMFCI